jgi:hypothetical protein
MHNKGNNYKPSLHLDYTIVAWYLYQPDMRNAARIPTL